MNLQVTSAAKQLSKATNKLTNVNKLAKPTKDLSQLSKFRNGGSAAYWGYKAFQALRLCSGDVTTLVEIAAELLDQGLCAGLVANPGMIFEAVQAVVSAYGGIQSFRKNVKNFAQFSEALSKQLNADGKTQTNGRAMDSAEHLYTMFTQACCDSDGSGGISVEEYVYFCGREGIPRSVAETTFFQADIDGNGQISFEEWTAMMIGRVGRDEDSFNCGGHHGLVQYVAVFNGMACDFCGAPIQAGFFAKGCRRCDCDACATCSGLPTTPAPPPQLPPRDGLESGSASAPGQTKKKAKKKGKGGTKETVGTKKVKKVVATGEGKTKVKKQVAASGGEGKAKVNKKVAAPAGEEGKAKVKKKAVAPAGDEEEAKVKKKAVAPGGEEGKAKGTKVKKKATPAPRPPTEAPPPQQQPFQSRPPARVHVAAAPLPRASAWEVATTVQTWPDSFDCRLRHGLTLYTVPFGLPVACDWCGASLPLGYPAVGCRACDVDGCLDCAARSLMPSAGDGSVSGSALGLTCPGLHGLTMAAAGPGCVCDLCGCGVGAGSKVFSCRLCDMDACVSCIWRDHRRRSQQAEKVGRVNTTPAAATSQPRPSPAVPPPPSYDTIGPPSTRNDQAASVAMPPYHGMPAGGVAAVAEPPKYEEVTTSSQARSPPSYADISVTGSGGSGTNTPTDDDDDDGDASDEEVEPPPFAFDSVVRVLGVDDPRTDGKLMTVVGFEPCPKGGEGIVVLQRKRKVVRVPAENVFNVVG
ncbi:unnamed protein product [Ectocarpus sp. CCAP 1310/34]|nr:unnamed protein product [Ectocarpus sp. CCAP 1310/34]